MKSHIYIPLAILLILLLTLAYLDFNSQWIVGTVVAVLMGIDSTVLFERIENDDK